MNWTQRDTSYLSAILLLSLILAFLLFESRIQLDEKLLQHFSDEKPVRVEGGTFYPSSDGGGVIIDDTPELQKIPVSAGRNAQIRSVRITPGMTRSELARLLDMPPEDLPPSEEIGVIDE